MANAWKCSLFPNQNNTSDSFYEDVIINVRVSVASFSLLGSVFVLALIWLFKKYKFFVQRLILYLSFSAFLSSIAYILGRVDINPQSDVSMKFCEFQGYMLLYTDWAVLLSVLCITFNLVLNVMTSQGTSRLEPVYFIINFVLPFGISCIPLVHNSFGPSGAWCWIRSRNEDCSVFRFGKILQFGVWYVPQFVLIFLIFCMYISVIIKLRIKTSRWQGTYDPNVELRRNLLRDEIKTLVWYPTIYFVVCIFPLINRIVYNFCNKVFVPLYLLHVISAPLQGALTALVYAVDKDTLRRLNWGSIKTSFQYRNTDDIVREYPIKTSSNEEAEPFITEPEYHEVRSPDHPKLQ